MSTISRTMRAAVLGAALVAVPAVTVTTPAAAGAAVTCPVVYWGSLSKTSALNPVVSTVHNLRTGRHSCFDRLVVDIGGRGQLGYTVRYVTVFSQTAAATLSPWSATPTCRSPSTPPPAPRTTCRPTNPPAGRMQ